MIKRNDSFVCEQCGKEVSSHPSSERNHCPFCLFSKHMDTNAPGDRLATCHALMKPVSIEYNGKKGNMIVHECTKCKKRMKNTVSDDDNFDRIVELSVQ